MYVHYTKQHFSTKVSQTKQILSNFSNKSLLPHAQHPMKDIKLTSPQEINTSVLALAEISVWSPLTLFILIMDKMCI